jgi:predicted NAD-dependent protein-ADP-ribosyltransferase YbiA (DUF1768 family)
LNITSKQQKFHEPEIQELIREASTPKQARSLGQSRTFPLRADWDEVREEVMLKAVRLKLPATAEGGVYGEPKEFL